MSATLSAGVYLRLRRQAAGLTPDALGLRMSPTGNWARFNARAIEALEGDAWIPNQSFIDRLGRALPFDRYVFRQLLNHLEPTLPICRQCGCSEHDACVDETYGPCAWTSPARDLCTHCQRARMSAEEAA
jgi:hypothetical protein